MHACTTVEIVDITYLYELFMKFTKQQFSFLELSTNESYISRKPLIANADTESSRTVCSPNIEEDAHCVCPK